MNEDAPTADSLEAGEVRGGQELMILDMWKLIYGYLPTRDVLRGALVCKSFLNEFPNLITRLWIERAINRQGIQAVSQRFSRLESLELNPGNTEPLDLRSCMFPTLTKLVLCSCLLDKIEFSTNNTPNLKYLSIEYSSGPAALCDFSLELPRLQTLRLQNLRFARPSSFGTSLSQCPQLSTFSADGLSGLAGLVHEIFLPSMQLFSMCSCVDIYSLVLAAPQLEYLNLDGCSAVEAVRLVNLPGASTEDIFVSIIMTSIEYVSMAHLKGHPRISFLELDPPSPAPDPDDIESDTDDEAAGLAGLALPQLAFELHEEPGHDADQGDQDGAHHADPVAHPMAHGMQAASAPQPCRLVLLLHQVHLDHDSITRRFLKATRTRARCEHALQVALDAAVQPASCRSTFLDLSPMARLIQKGAASLAMKSATAEVISVIQAYAELHREYQEHLHLQRLAGAHHSSDEEDDDEEPDTETLGAADESSDEDGADGADEARGDDEEPGTESLGAMDESGDEVGEDGASEDGGDAGDGDYHERLETESLGTMPESGDQDGEGADGASEDGGDAGDDEEPQTESLGATYESGDEGGTGGGNGVLASGTEAVMQAAPAGQNWRWQS